MSDPPAETPEPVPCLNCGLPLGRDPQHRPFCSLRCQAVDLHGWLDGSYQTPFGRDEE